jgi:guanine deaminase
LASSAHARVSRYWKRAGSSVAHCPLSNFYFSNAIFPARRMLDRGLKVGLGTDIGGGPSASILENARAAAHAARALEEGVHAELPPTERGRPGARLTPADVLWMATRGGAQALGIDSGAFVPGFEFDAVVLDTDAPHSNLVLFDGLDGPEQIAEKVVYSAGRQNVVRVYCQGREIYAL